MREHYKFLTITAIIFFALWAFLPLQISFRSSRRGRDSLVISRGQAHALGLSEAEVYAALQMWFRNLYEQFEGNLMGRVQGAITGQIGNFENKFESVAYDAGGIGGNNYANMLGITNFGAEGFGDMDSMTANMMNRLSPDYSIFTPYNKLPYNGQDGFVYLGVNGDNNMYDIANEAINEAKNGQTTFENQLVSNSPYAPTSNWDIQNNMSVPAYQQQTVRFTKTLVGEPVDINSEVKGESPSTAMMTIHDLTKANVDKKLASDIASSAAANIFFTTNSLKQMQALQIGLPGDSYVKTLKDMAKVEQTQTIILDKILLTLSQQSYATAESLSRAAGNYESTAAGLHMSSAH